MTQKTWTQLHTVNINIYLKTKLESIISYIIKELSNNIIGKADIL